MENSGRNLLVNLLVGLAVFGLISWGQKLYTDYQRSKITPDLYMGKCFVSKYQEQGPEHLYYEIEMAWGYIEDKKKIVTVYTFPNDPNFKPMTWYRSPSDLLTTYDLYRFGEEHNEVPCPF